MATEGETTRHPGFRVIDLMVIVCVLVLALAIVLPLVRQARINAHQQQCLINLKQVALGTLNYETVNGVFPPGGYGSVDPVTGESTFGFSVLLPILPYVEHNQFYLATNFDLGPLHPANRTIAAVPCSVLWCPADPTVAGSRRVSYPALYAPSGGWSQTYTSYGAIVGTHGLDLHPTDPTFALRQANLNGIIRPETNTSMASITDGTSSTMLFGEHRHADLPDVGPPDGRDDYHWWHSGHWNDALIEARHTVNARVPAEMPTFRRAMNLGSGHPGGAHVVMADGSVRFLKDTIQSWPIDTTTGRPIGVNYDPAKRVYSFDPRARPGVLQKISTRASGEIVAPGSF